MKNRANTIVRPEMTCDLCGKVVHGTFNLNRHMEHHKNEKKSKNLAKNVTTTILTPNSNKPSSLQNHLLVASSASSSRSSPPNTNQNKNIYQCHLCDFTTERLNIIVLHNKMHAADDRERATPESSKKSGTDNSDDERYKPNTSNGKISIKI